MVDPAFVYTLLTILLHLQLPKSLGVARKSYTSEPQVWLVLDHVSEKKKEEQEYQVLFSTLLKTQDDCSFHHIKCSNFNKTLKCEQVVFQSMSKNT